MALRLRGSDSGYVEIDAPAVAGSNSITLPATTGTINVKDGSGNTEVGTGVTFGNPGANIFTINNTGGERLRIAADGTVSIPGALNVSGVLTYEDVTSVDAIGLSTFRDGLNTKDVGITTISTSVSDTAVDVFIYDTSKDSDGGEWRKRTSHTSWYNETLNTATRGSRREFPAVAVIVAEYETLTIYDGDDPDLPMWMVFNYGSNGIENMTMLYSNGTAVTALNGIICSGGNTSWHDGLTEYNFIEDFSRFRNNNNIADWTGGIGTRNTAGGYGSFYNTAGMYIVDSSVNDIAMTVLPNAPIDDATGLPVPTIAVATQGGISVINDSGVVFDLTPESNVAYDSIKNFMQVAFTKENHLVFTDRQGSGSFSNVLYLPFYNYNSDLTDSYSDLTDAYVYKWNTAISFNSTVIGSWKETNNQEEWDYLTTTSDSFVVANGDYSNGLGGIVKIGTVPNQVLVAYATTSYNTGWMHGDIKGAFLSDTDTTNATASTNLASGMTLAATARLTSHTYDAGDTSWQMVDNAADANGYVQIYLNGTTAGKQYFVSATFDSNPALDSGYDFNVFSNSSASQIATFSHWDGAGAGTLTAIYTAEHQADDSSTQSDILSIYVNATTANITNFTVREATEADRSASNKSLAVFGTITKSAVATGAELVDYSGFSGFTNYLFQPAGVMDLSGTHSFIVWFKTTGVGEIIIHHGERANNQLRCLFVDTSGQLAYATYANDLSGTSSVDDGNWHCGVGVYDGSNFKIYVDGKLEATSTLSPASFTDIGTYIGVNSAGLQSFTGNLALLRVSATVPSAEQIKKIYEDEKYLFQENAKCTLYGSSDAVTALGYDETTDQLHVGTSSGRSDFQGLLRINNTTTAVTTAISAHDSFILEQ